MDVKAAAVALLLMTGCAFGGDLTVPIEMAPPPAAYPDFCKRYPADCLPPKDLATQVTLSPSVWKLLHRVNATVNTSIKAREDDGDRWTYAEDGYGDCEDYVLVKRRELIKAGLPPRALMIAVVWTRIDTGHMVLLVRTNEGDYTLDSLSPEIKPWRDTPYDYVKRQLPEDPSKWVYIDGGSSKEPNSTDK